MALAKTTVKSVSEQFRRLTKEQKMYIVGVMQGMLLKSEQQRASSQQPHSET